MVEKLFSWSSAVLLALGIGLTQLLLGGWWYPWLALPGYVFLSAAAIMASLRGWKISDTPGAWCSGLALAFAGYLFWRQSSSLDAYAAREDAWLLLGALCVYLTVAWHLRGTGPRWLLIGVLLALSIAQVLLAVAQFAAVMPFHPMADLARQLRLPVGKLAVANLGLITGTLHARTALSGVLEVTTFLALGLLVWGRCAVWVKLLLLWAAAAGFVGMIICLSRSAYLALPAGVIVFALASFFVVQRGVLKHRLLLAVGALGLVGLALGLGVATGYESLAVWFRLDELAVDKYRQDLWTITVPPMLSLDPVFGAGANTFEDLARRYRGVGFTADPIHAHSDWLQLLIEYGWIGLVLGAGFFFVHFAAGWRNVLRLARATPADGLLPQSMELGLATGSLAAFAAIGTHVVFDYSLHLPVVAMLTALCAGWLAAARPGPADFAGPIPRWLKPLGILPLLPGVVLAVWIWRDAPAERQVLAAENALVPLRVDTVAASATGGLATSPQHPRLLWLSGLATRQKATALAASDPREAMNGLLLAADSYRGAVKARPNDVFAWYELGRTLDTAAFATETVAETSGNPVEVGELQLQVNTLRTEALAAHLRCIGRDPDHARGYESLARHYAMQREPERARRSAELATRLAGARQASSMLGVLRAAEEKEKR